VLKRVLIVLLLGHTLLSAPFFVSWHGDEATGQLSENSSEDNFNEMDADPGLPFAPPPANLPTPVSSPIAADSTYSVTVTMARHSPPSRASPVLPV
jgi:hypothetical protein